MADTYNLVMVMVVVVVLVLAVLSWKESPPRQEKYRPTKDQTKAMRFCHLKIIRCAPRQ
jgi:hypothetical protein